VIEFVIALIVVGAVLLVVLQQRETDRQDPTRPATAAPPVRVADVGRAAVRTGVVIAWAVLFVAILGFLAFFAYMLTRPQISVTF